ncbi:hypothetical protein BDN71DRAFT_1428550 [Pleurotus eryngii]|uniref:Uncharacterized protein n=1 Tax=Pleurotus eryngii TaxID=5323 RepID=A0A9P6A458_PLEER|nr:hypothetical protein BDN71DRAFT_1428550 [Pleurotus eryngii]
MLGTQGQKFMNTQKYLQELSTLLQFLLSLLPEGCEHHEFHNWQPDPDKLAEFSARRQPGEILFKLCERRAALLMVVDMLARELVDQPESVILLNLGGGLMKACKAHYHKAKIDLCFLPSRQAFTLLCLPAKANGFVTFEGNRGSFKWNWKTKGFRGSASAAISFSNNLG